MLSIILPAYNEEENIEEAVRGAFEFLRTLRIPFELIIVNDGSKDKTGMILQELRSRYTNLVIIQHVQNLGKGAALISGFTKAQGELVFFTDSDQQVKITELKNFLNQIDSYDFAVGYRLKRQDPWHRR
ncbi:TPA: glycosyltransferase family 2 protein, partial [Candidatus Giovannonibacteria bacterium]|nr:glycosyltransferase family 2 protein [Candidatus Giovannonibacteria bacterium]